MARLVIVSNRVTPPKEQARAGGLAVAIRDVLRRHGGLWFGWSGEVENGTDAPPNVYAVGGVSYATLDLSREEHDRFYAGYANSTLWPLFHYRLGLVEYRREDLFAYIRVNARFAAALAPMLGADDLVWAHDYHLIPFAAELRRLGARHKLGFFLHTPFPAAAVLTALPVHRELIGSLCQYDLVGFQSDGDLRAFRDYVANEAGGEWLDEGRVRVGDRVCRAAVFPIGIDAKEFAAIAVKTSEGREATRLRESLAGRSLIVGVDRLDYSKGLPHRFDALERLLIRWPEHRRQVTYLQIAPISREAVAQYRSLRRELDASAGRINARFAEFDWMPLRYLNRGFPRKSLAAFYRAGRIGLVTPLRDGMNLVAKEYVASQNPENPGVLVLSKFAGAAAELSSALIVNPYDTEAIAEAVHGGLTMPLDERRARWRSMMDQIETNSIAAWRENFIAALKTAA